MIKPCTDLENGFIPMIDAITLVVGLPEDSKRLDNGGLDLLSRVRRMDSVWEIRECWEKINNEEVHFVHLGEFIEWAWDQGFHAPRPLITKVAETENSSIKFQNILRFSEIESEIAELEKTPSNSISEIQYRNQRIEELEKEKKVINTKLYDSSHELNDES